MENVDILILDTDFKPLAVVDTYESFIWTDRYQSCGDFEFYSPVTDNLLSIFKLNRYLRIKGSERVMIIETIKITSSTEDGAHMTVTGRSLEQILMRRVVQGTVTINGNLQTELIRLINENIISPDDENRKIDNFVVEESSDESVSGVDVTLTEYTSESLYDIIKDQCSDHKIGFKVILNSNSQFVFKLYNGVNRTFSQTNVPWVLFSPDNDNLSNSSFIESVYDYSNVVLINGEGNADERIYLTITQNDDSFTGLNRREMYVNASDIAQEVTSSDGETTISYTDEEYEQMLKNRGYEELEKTVESDGFEAEADVNIKYKYGNDFFIGDVVQLANEYGNELEARVSEVVFSYDETGYHAYPTFISVNEEDD